MEKCYYEARVIIGGAIARTSDTDNLDSALVRGECLSNHYDDNNVEVWKIALKNSDCALLAVYRNGDKVV